ncbi:MAG: hypothetical protein KDB82_06085 [Planctomycetes bacterium]|nr:hypothetical protein [Planctomycetota bacterium]
MNEDDLVKLASKAADEPIGDAADSAELAELEQAMAVLRGATEEASEPRMNELAERAADQSRLVHLWHFAAVAVVFFCIGLVVLFKMGFTPPVQTTPVADHNEPGPVENPGSISPANHEPRPEQQIYVRPKWIDEQAAEVANAPSAPDLGGGPGSGSPDGVGGGTGGSEGSGGSPFGNPPGSRGSHPDHVEFTLLYPAKAPNGMHRVSSTTLPDTETGAGFTLHRVEYAGPGKALVLLEAAETADSRKALSADGLEGNAVSVVRDGTVVLLISNTLSKSELAAIAAKLVENS